MNVQLTMAWPFWFAVGYLLVRGFRGSVQIPDTVTMVVRTDAVIVLLYWGTAASLAAGYAYAAVTR